MARGTRERMIASATLLLRERGVAGTSFAGVLEHAEAPRGSVRHHFPGGKAELVEEALVAASAEITGHLRRAAEQGADAAQLLAGVCEYFGAWLSRTDFAAGCPVAAVAQEQYAEPRLASLAASAIADWVGVLTSVLVGRGTEEPAARQLAQVTVAAVEGAIMMARVQRTLAPLEAVRDQLTPLLKPGSATTGA